MRMDTLLRAFKEIAVYLRHPLVLIGFALLFVFSAHYSLTVERSVSEAFLR